MDFLAKTGRSRLATATLFAAAIYLAAQAPAWGEASLTEGLVMIEEITVTARKRAENLQDVPAAVSAFSAADLQERGIENITEIARQTPNVTINETGGLVAGALSVFIRGIGNDPGFDQGVGIYVDEVYLNRQTGAVLDVYDVQRIEVLKGPQGHLYGRNTIGGAVKYVSREPDAETRASMEAKLGTDSLRQFKASLSGALAEDRLFGGMAVSLIDRDGYQTNRFDGGDWGSKDSLAARASLIWDASAAFRVKLVGDYFKDDSAPAIPKRVAVNLAGPAGLGTFQALMSTANMFVPGAAYLAPGDALDINIDPDLDSVNSSFLENGYNEFEIKSRGLALTATWDLNEAWSLKSVSAGRWLDNTTPYDFDGSDQLFIDTIIRAEARDLSQEIQLNYNGGNINGVLGLYYLNGEQDWPTLTNQSARLRLTTSHVKDMTKDERKTKSLSFYANIDWDLSEQWQLSFGGRWTRDKKTLDQVATVTLTNHVAAFLRLPGLEQAPLLLSPLGAQILPNLPFFNFFLPHRDQLGNIIGRGNVETVITYPEPKIGDESWSEFTPSAKLRYRPNDSLMLYAGVATGFKSGGFDARGALLNAPTYKPETVTSYALGLKTTLAEGSLRINAEGFLNDYTEKQLRSIALTDAGRLLQVIDNVGEVESVGAEVEILWLPPVEGLAFNLNVGWLDSDIEEFIEIQEQETGGPVEVNIADSNALGYSPKWNVQARAQYSFALGGAGSLTVGADMAYRSKMYTNSPVDISDPFQLLTEAEANTTYNAFMTYRSEDERWRLTLEGKNLSDERVLEHTFQVSNFILGGYPRGRTWGLTLAYDLR